MSKSAIYTVNTTAPTVAVNGTIPLGNTVRRYGTCIRQDGNAISICGKGYYLVTASVTASPTAAGNVTVTLLKDGVAVPGATGTATVAANGTTDISISCIVRNICDCGGSLVSLALTGTASVVNNAAVTVEKL